MKIVDKFYISNSLLKNNVKRLTRVIIMLVISISILISSAFLLSSFLFGIKSEINANKSNFSIEVKYGNSLYQKSLIRKGLYLDKSYYQKFSTKYNNNLSSSYHSVRVVNLMEHSDAIHDINVHEPIFTIDSTKYDLGVTSMGAFGTSGCFNMLFYDMENTNSFLSKNDMDYLNKNGMSFTILGDGFSVNSKEVIISSAVLDALKISDYKSVIGKKMSMDMFLANAVTDYYGKQHQNESIYGFDPIYYQDKYTVFSDYTIVGVFNKDIFNLPLEMQSSYFWFKKEVYFDSSEYVSMEKFLNYDDMLYPSYKIDYKELEQIANASGQVFLAPGYSTYLNELTPNIIQRYSFDTLKDTYNFYTYVTSYFTEAQRHALTPLNLNTLLRAYIKYFPALKALVIILSFVGLAILLASFIDFYCVIYEDLKTNEKFFASLISNGLKERDLSIIYSIYQETIIVISLIISCIISFILSFVLMNTANKYFDKFVNAIGLIKYSLDFKYYFISLGIVSLTMILIILLISIIFSISIRRRNLAKTLKYSE